MILKKLTQEQEQKLIEFRAEMFAQATSTAPADRPRAEAAARRMAEIAGVKINNVIWVSSPEAGAEAVKRAWDNLRASLRDRLSDSLWVSLRDSLRDRLRDSLSDSLWVSLRDSLSDSLWDSPWQTFYAFPMLHMGVAYTPEAREKLELHREIGASCFALWIVPGTVILCERPAAVEIVDGKLVGLTWRMEVRDEN